MLQDSLKCSVVPVYVAQCFMTMCVSALALTSLDAVARIGRMSFQELFSVDDMEHAEGWRKFLCNTYFSTILTLCMCLCSDTNWICKYLAIVRISQPAAFRSGTCNTLRIPESDRKKQQNAFRTADHHALRNRNRTGRKNNRSCKSLRRPAQLVFLVEGLQLIIAVLLMALGLVIVINSLKAYFGAKKESEA